MNQTAGEERRRAILRAEVVRLTGGSEIRFWSFLGGSLVDWMGVAVPMFGLG
jgi:hypothetical protein